MQPANWSFDSYICFVERPQFQGASSNTVHLDLCMLPWAPIFRVVRYICFHGAIDMFTLYFVIPMFLYWNFLLLCFLEFLVMINMRFVISNNETRWTRPLLALQFLMNSMLVIWLKCILPFIYTLHLLNI